jgi:hypothetical protein
MEQKKEPPHQQAAATMLAARTALYRIVVSPRRIPSAQTWHLSTSIPNDGGVVVSQTKTTTQSSPAGEKDSCACSIVHRRFSWPDLYRLLLSFGLDC